jgi:uncharacterized membrane protein YdjX (TVP38/TMEM64 family)
MRFFCTALVIIALVATACLFQHHAIFILNRIKDLGWIAPILFLLLYTGATVLLLPTMVLTLAGGALFGPALGIMWNLLGASLGASLAFCISRYYGTDWLAKKRGPKINRLIGSVEKNGWQCVALLRLLPIVPFSFVNYGLGLTDIKFSHYIITTFIFLTPAEIIYTYCGYAGMGFLTQETSCRSSSIIILMLIGLGILALKLIKYYQSKYGH